MCVPSHHIGIDMLAPNVWDEANDTRIHDFLKSPIRFLPPCPGSQYCLHLKDSIFSFLSIHLNL